MAGFTQPGDNEVFYKRDTLNQPCDVVLVVEDGKQFKAHRKVLSEASPFFEKLLNSDMKESKEGIVRLEMFSESVMAATLEFIYTGHVQILTEDNARDLIVVADYLLIQKLKTLAEGVLTENLNISNCISIYYLSERYQCEELFFVTKKFILANFTAMYAANREDVLNMSSKEVELWISSDEIDVSAEEDVFKIILAWIDYDKSKRKKYFAELFRQVRLVYVSRDFLSSDVVTNDLVKENEDCLDLVKDAMNIIDSRNFNNLSVSPRKTLESPAIVVWKDADFLCYFPDDDNWCRLGEIPSELKDGRFDEFFPCGGKLFNTIVRNSVDMISYCPYTNTWLRLPPLENRYLWKIFVRNEDEMWALLSDASSPSSHTIALGIIDKKHYSLFVSKYQPLSRTWEDVASFDHFHPSLREGYCILASGNFIYFIGGVKHVGSPIRRFAVYLSDVDRYDLSKGQWDKVADIQVARSRAHGAAANGRIFIGGGFYHGSHLWSDPLCEMYDETTNEWQLIASFKKPGAIFLSILAADDKLYAVSCETSSLAVICDLEQIYVECYNPEKNEWRMKTETSVPVSGLGFTTCSTRIFKGLSIIRPLYTSTPESLSKKASSSHHRARKRNYSIV